MNESPNTPKRRDAADPASDEQLMAAFMRARRRHLASCSRGTSYRCLDFSRRLADPAHAEELTQETFLAVLRAASRYEPRALFRTYLYAIGFRILRAHRRKAAFRLAFLGAAGFREPAAQTVTDAEIVLRQAVGKLERTDREILMLREFEELSYSEIAELLRLPVNPLAFIPRTDGFARPARRPRAQINRRGTGGIRGTHMNTNAHAVTPEEIMAFLDGELSAPDAQAVAAHLDTCAECNHMAGQFRKASQELKGWTAAGPALSWDSFVLRAAGAASGGSIRGANAQIRAKSWTWKQWALAGGGTIALLLLVLAVSVPNLLRPRQALLRQKVAYKD